MGISKLCYCFLNRSLSRFETENIRRVANQPFGKEQVGIDVTKTFYVESVSRNEVAKTLYCLRGTNKPSSAAHINTQFSGFLIYLPNGVTFTFRAKFRENKRHGTTRTVPIENTNDLRNNVARTLYFNLVTLTSIESIDLIGVVQRGIPDYDTAHCDRLKARHRC